MSALVFGVYLPADAMAANETSSTGQMFKRYPRWSEAVHPYLLWRSAAMSQKDPGRGSPDYDSVPIRFRPSDSHDPTFAILGIALYGASAWMLWYLARRRLESEGRE
jgi:hypothetical protein